MGAWHPPPGWANPPPGPQLGVGKGFPPFPLPFPGPFQSWKWGHQQDWGTGLGMGLDGCRGEPDSPKSWLHPADWPQPPPIFLLAWGRHRPSSSKLGPAITADPEQGRQQDGHHPTQGCFLPAQQCPNLRRDLETLPPLPRLPSHAPPLVAQTPAAFPLAQLWVWTLGLSAAVPQAGRCRFPR